MKESCINLGKKTKLAELVTTVYFREEKVNKKTKSGAKTKEDRAHSQSSMHCIHIQGSESSVSM